VLQWTLLSSVSLFFAAHLLLFKLHIPNRYTQHSFRILLAIAAAIALTVLLDALSSWVRKRPTFSRKRTSWGIAGFLALTLVIYPAIAPLKTAYPGLRVLGNPFPGYVQGRAPETYRFFKQQPKDILIASVLLEANNLPIFAHRSVLAAREFAIPYHLGYYRQFRERVIDQIQAQYSTNPKQVKQFTEKYGIDFWVVDANAPTPRYLQKSWLQQYQPAAAEAANSLQQGTVPVVQQAVERCAVLQENGLAVLSADCVVNSLPPSMAQ
jgi:hypothetical protein